MYIHINITVPFEYCLNYILSCAQVKSSSNHRDWTFLGGKPKTDICHFINYFIYRKSLIFVWYIIIDVNW